MEQSTKTGTKHKKTNDFIFLLNVFLKYCTAFRVAKMKEFVAMRHSGENGDNYVPGSTWTGANSIEEERKSNYDEYKNWLSTGVNQIRQRWSAVDAITFSPNSSLVSSPNQVGGGEKWGFKI